MGDFTGCDAGAMSLESLDTGVYLGVEELASEAVSAADGR